MTTFYEFGLSHSVIRAINNMGFEEATPIQGQTIPIALKGEDLIGQAQTGTGKTAAFGIPLIEKMEVESGHIQGLIITPTRELAIQVAEELNKIGEFRGVRTLPIYGGQDINRQIKSLKKKPSVIVGTPGRIMDHMRRNTIRLTQIKMVVLDEADEMMNMGFIDDIKAILQEIPDHRQTLLFSATMPEQIAKLAEQFMKNPKQIKIKAKDVSLPAIEQHYIEVPEKQKFDVLCRLIDIQSPNLAIVFGRTKRRVDELSEALNKRGYLAEGLHGDLTQARREIVLRQFKEGIIDILVATDVAARGLDISDVTHVYNFDIPQDPESYIHRIGRTGRAGKTGLATTLVTPREMDHLKSIEHLTKRKIIRKPVPTLHDAIEGKQRLTVERLEQFIEQDGNIDRYKALAEKLLKENDSVTLLASALKMLTKQPNTDPITLTEVEPLRIRKSKNNFRPFRQKEKNSQRQGGKKRKKQFSH
ncbi:DEAD/DEAH box helicase [Microaerobacter geothermalis]|uniref:DEAD/DEAH box helicase n=1 Tax=Microaerobacter geothermalis TaxID=674972 RepID=UPI001F1D0C01|nr:DEAD/DEAH box helicase [Microaerobacter geothermalis]MCF6093105.1 DEAD/DEAH box helicase [Microaerobacter geothermalis]